MFYLLTKKGRLSRQRARDLYNQIVRQSRSSIFYEGYEVPDTLEGRFEMICLFGGLLVTRLCRPDMGNEGRVLAQAFFDTMFINLDWSIREMGVGDLGVPRRVKAMMASFKGRAFAYDESLRVGQGEVRHVLSRNLYATAPHLSPEVLQVMSAYVMDCASGLNNQGLSDFWQGRVSFPDIEKSLKGNYQGTTNVSQAA